MRLSIIAMFCDKDYKLVNKFVENIKEKIKCSYELILVDNREKKINKKINVDCKIIKVGYNSFNFEGKRIGLDYATGEYVWFVDIDDVITNEVKEEDFKDGYDFVQFYYDIREGNSLKPYMKVNNIEFFGRGLWCRWFNTEKMKEVLAPIKRNIKLTNYEDTFMLILFTQKYDKVYFLNKTLYYYNNKEKISKKKKRFLATGMDDIVYLSNFIYDKASFLNSISYGIITTR